ncbi:sigma-70 family RNA polymerase sigma factor [Niveispirillum fermenti]|uniref:sigma-70 family RNA polymerase sigma factor n=1 Tax=Niveispirillum fermenti TaxID=1233113 RepID=UPI003A86A4DF
MASTQQFPSQVKVNASLSMRVAAERDYLRRFALSLCSDPVLADDLAQECVERALTRLHLWEEGTNLRAWLSTMLRNLYINGLRRNRSHVALDDCSASDIGGLPARQMERMQLRDLRRAMARLPSDQRDMVVMVGLQGISYEQAAQRAQVSVGTVKSRLSRARGTLRRLMDGEAGMHAV